MALGARIGCAFMMLLAALVFPWPASAVEVGGVKLEDAVKVGGQELKLNGAGVRYKAIFKVYAAGLYLNGKKTATSDVLAAAGPRRIVLVMLRDVGNEEFGQSFMAGIQKNSEKAERAKMITQLLKFGKMFASVPLLKKGDVILIDWIPNSGTHIFLNDKKIVDVLPDLAFYNMILKIWLGENPADSNLKNLLLGAGDDTSRSTNSY